MATRDAVLHATARLAGDWDAPAFARTTLSGPGGKAILRELAARFASLDPLVRVRLLLSAAHIAPRAARERCAEELSALAAAALSDREEWAVALGAALGGDFSSAGGQRLDLPAAAAAAPTLRETRGSLDAAALAAVEAAVEAAAAGREAVAPGFWPREERYLTPRLRAAARGGAYDDGEAGGGARAPGAKSSSSSSSSYHGHFVPRPAEEGGEDPLVSILPRSVVDMRGGNAARAAGAAGAAPVGAVATTAAAANAAAAAAAAAALAAAAEAQAQAQAQAAFPHAPVSTSLFSPLHPPALGVAAAEDEEERRKREELQQQQQQQSEPPRGGDGAAAAARLFLPRASGPGGLAMGGPRAALAVPPPPHAASASASTAGNGAGNDSRRPAGAARSVRAKVLDVGDSLAIALQQSKPSLPLPSSHATAAAPSAQQPAAEEEEEEEEVGMEEGEIEEGELEGGDEEEEAAAAANDEQGEEPYAKRPRPPPPPPHQQHQQQHQQRQQQQQQQQGSRGEWRDYDAPEQYGGGALDYD